MKTNTIKKAALKASVIPLTAAALMLGGCGSSVKVTSEHCRIYRRNADEVFL